VLIAPAEAGVSSPGVPDPARETRAKHRLKSEREKQTLENSPERGIARATLKMAMRGSAHKGMSHLLPRGLCVKTPPLHSPPTNSQQVLQHQIQPNHPDTGEGEKGNP
jgi:hypothetical protein